MLYHADPGTGTTKFYTDPHSRSRLPFRTAKEMRGLYPDGNFTIVGEIGGLTRPLTAGDELLTDDGGRIPILPRGSLIKPFEWVAGYVPVNRNAYLAAAGSVCPAFLRRWTPFWMRPSP